MDIIVKLGNNLEGKKLDIYLILYTRINSYTNLKHIIHKSKQNRNTVIKK